VLNPQRMQQTFSPRCPIDATCDSYYHLAVTSKSAPKWNRDAKRLATMRRVQAAALDLFEARGFGAVTIEAIANAAQVSAPTVYRHFGTKEQIVLWDEYDPLIFAAAVEGARGRTLLESLTLGLVRAVESIYGSDAKRILRRAKLMRAEPVLRQANASALAAMRDGLAQSLVASHACEDDLEAEVVAGAVASALETAVRHWEKAEGKKPLGRFVSETLRRLARLTGDDTRGPEAKAAGPRKAKSAHKRGVR
jgi:AcrR family transcriptional regulator